MIEANDLMVGNWVEVIGNETTNTHFSKIVYIDSYYKRVIVDRRGDYGMGCSLEQINPIELTT